MGLEKDRRIVYRLYYAFTMRSHQRETINTTSGKWRENRLLPCTAPRPIAFLYQLPPASIEKPREPDTFRWNGKLIRSILVTLDC
jgi:hypothetical protein